MQIALLLQLLNAGLLATEQIIRYRQEMQQLKTKVETIVAEGREPTEAEWAELQARSDAAHAAIQAWTPTPETTTDETPSTGPVADTSPA